MSAFRPRAVLRTTRGAAGAIDLPHIGELSKAFGAASLPDGAKMLKNLGGDFGEFKLRYGNDIAKTLELQPGLDRTQGLKNLQGAMQEFMHATDSRFAQGMRRLKDFLSGPIGNALILGSAVGFIPWIVDTKKNEAYQAEQERKAAEQQAKYDAQVEASKGDGKLLTDALVGINSMFLWLAIGGGILLVVMIAFMAMSADSGSSKPPGTPGAGGGGLF